MAALRGEMLCAFNALERPALRWILHLGQTSAVFERSETLGLVRSHEEHPVVIYNADAKAIQPTGAAEKVSAECRILGEEDHCLKLNAQRLNGNLVFVCGERSSNCSKTLKSTDSTASPSISPYLRSKMQCAAPVSSFARRSTDRLPMQS